MYLCGRGGDFASFYEFSIRFCYCSDSVGFFFFILLLNTFLFVEYHFCGFRWDHQATKFISQRKAYVTKEIIT